MKIKRIIKDVWCRWDYLQFCGFDPGRELIALQEDSIISSPTPPKKGSSKAGGIHTVPYESCILSNTY